jgi:hypothetical protein
MKKIVYSIFLGFALIASFASCNKNENKHVIQDGKILLTADQDLIDPETKHSFNTSNRTSFFNTDDSVFINGRAYAVFPYSTNIYESTNASAHARIWADISSSGDYKGLYPKSAFTNQITDFDHPSVYLPDTVVPIPTSTFYMGNTFEINPAVDGRIIPMTAYVTNESINDNLQFHNTIGMILLKLRYNYEFAMLIDPTVTNFADLEGIYMEVTRVDITTPNVPITGTGVISNPFSTTPKLVINANGGHKIVYMVDSPVGISPTEDSPKDYVFLPIVDFPYTTATIDLYFTTHSLVSGQVRHFKYSKTITNGLKVERNKITRVNVGLSTSSDFNNYCTELF